MKNPKEMKILVVDDMPNMVRTIKNMLRHLGYHYTTVAGDGLAALEVLKKKEIDFVIADWNMPNMTGIDLLRKVRLDDDLKEIPFLMVTAEVAEETIAEAAETEVDGYIIKPFVAKTLEEKIQKILEKRNTPSEVDTCLKLGNVYLNSGMLDDALKEYEKSLKIQPNNARVHYALGNIYQKKGEIDKAEKAYEKAIGISPKYLKAHESLARLYEERGEQEKAIRAVKEAVKISPKNPERQIKLGKALLNTIAGYLKPFGFYTRIMGNKKSHETQTQRRIQILGRFFEMRNHPDPVGKEQEHKQRTYKGCILLSQFLVQRIFR